MLLKLNQTSRSGSESQESNQTVQDSGTGYGMDSPEPAPEVRQNSESDYVEGYEMQKETPVTEEESGGRLSPALTYSEFFSSWRQLEEFIWDSVKEGLNAFWKKGLFMLFSLHFLSLIISFFYT